MCPGSPEGGSCDHSYSWLDYGGYGMGYNYSNIGGSSVYAMVMDAFNTQDVGTYASYSFSNGVLHKDFQTNNFIVGGNGSGNGFIYTGGSLTALGNGQYNQLEFHGTYASKVLGYMNYAVAMYAYVTGTIPGNPPTMLAQGPGGGNTNVGGDIPSADALNTYMSWAELEEYNEMKNAKNTLLPGNYDSYEAWSEAMDNTPELKKIRSDYEIFMRELEAKWKRQDDITRIVKGAGYVVVGTSGAIIELYIHVTTGISLIHARYYEYEEIEMEQ
jgi:hypothetical protein